MRQHEPVVAPVETLEPRLLMALVDLVVNVATGAATLRPGTGALPGETGLAGYQITSNGNSLRPANWSSLDDQDVAGWEEFAARTDFLAEGTLGQAVPIESMPAGIGIGDLFDPSSERDLQFTYAPGTGPAARAGEVIYEEPTTTVVGRRVFYNRSAFDGTTAQVPDGPNDDAAIATDKSALLPGGTAANANYTDYSRGLNGIMVDLALPDDGDALALSDFQLRTGNDNTPNDWAAAPDPTLAVRPNAGTGGADRVVLTWGSDAVQRAWLEVTVRATANTTLASADVFYFGNLPGDTFDSAAGSASFLVNSLDVQRTRINQFQQATITSLFDHDKSNNIVNAVDVQLSRINQFSSINRIAVPIAGGVRAAPAGAAAAPRLGNLFAQAPLTEASHRDKADAALV